MSEVPMDLYFPEEDEEVTPTGATAVSEPVKPATESVPIHKPSPQHEFEDDVYKKWFRTKTKQGFLTVRPFLSAGKLSIDIGELQEGSKSPDNTIVWVDALALATYLRSVGNHIASELYPQKGNDPEETFTYYGGARLDSGPVSRIFKVNYWEKPRQNKDGPKDYDKNGFAFKAGHFKAKESSSGAFIPDMSSPLRTNIIKVSRAEVAEMSYRVDLAIQRFVISNADPFRSLNGNNRN